METVAVVLSVAQRPCRRVRARVPRARAADLGGFQRAGRDADRIAVAIDISTVGRGPDVSQYLIVVLFATGEGHHEHDNDPRFAAWNSIADAWQVRDGLAFGGETILRVGPPDGGTGDAAASAGAGR